MDGRGLASDVEAPAAVVAAAAEDEADGFGRVAAVVGANTAFLANVIGSVPASWVVYGSLPRWAVAASIGLANILAGVLALTLPETAGIDLE